MLKEKFFRRVLCAENCLKKLQLLPKCCENLRRNWEIIFRVDYYGKRTLKSDVLCQEYNGGKTLSFAYNFSALIEIKWKVR